MLLLNPMPQLFQALGQDRRQAMHTAGDVCQAFGAMVDRVHAGDIGQQHLRGADVARGFLTTNVLFTGLHRQAQRRVAMVVDGNAYQAPGHVALEAIACRKVSGVRATETQGHAEALGTAQHHIGTKFTWRCQQGQCQQIGRHRHQCTGLVGALDQRTMIDNLAGTGRVLQQQAKIPVEPFFLQFGLVADHNLDV